MGCGGRAVRQHAAVFPAVVDTRSDEAIEQYRLAAAPDDLTRRLAGTSLVMPSVHDAHAAEGTIPKARWCWRGTPTSPRVSLDPQECEGAATPYNLTMAQQESLIKNAIGPRVAAEKWQDVFPTLAAAYPCPWEDNRLKE